MEKVNVTLRLDAEHVSYLDQLAQLMDRDRTYLIKQAVSQYIDVQRWQLEEVEKARKQIREGKFLSDEDFEADMKTWDQ